MIKELLTMMVLIFFILYFFWYMLIVLLPRKKYQEAKKINSDFKHYFLIPCLNEEDVIADTIIFWDKLIEKFPTISIILINDDSSDNTEQIIKENIKGKNNYYLLNRRKPNAQLGKGEALNEAYKIVLTDIIEHKYRLKKCIVTIFDADAIIYETYIKELEKLLSNDKVALVQARVSILGIKSWLELMQEIEFFTCVDGIQNIRGFLGNVAAGGNGQSVRVSSLGRDLAPWGNALLEDFEFSTRLILKGYETRHMYKEAVYQQGLKNYKQFIKQRGRWSQGGIQCLKYRQSILKSRKLVMRAKIEMFYFMILPFISLLAIGSYLILTISKYTEHTNVHMNLTLLLFINILPGCIMGVKYYFQKYYKSEKLSINKLIICIIAGCSIIIYDFSLVPSQVIAIYREYRGKTDWVKTQRQKKLT